MIIKAAIIDDEKDSINVIRSIITEYCSNIDIIGTANGVADGIKLIKDLKPDLIFLDIEMNDGTGFKILEKFPESSFSVIFITAYNHYAIKAIKFSATEYILKPINITELIKAVQKAEKQLSNKKMLNEGLIALLENLNSETFKKIAIPTSEGYSFIPIEKIIRIEAEGSYSNFFLIDKQKIMVSKKIKDYEDILPIDLFLRIHNSHIINLNHVEKYIKSDGGSVRMCGGHNVPVSKSKKDQFLEAIARISRKA